MALAATIMPSSTACGVASITERSMNAPGSPSSALHSTYFTSPLELAQNSHFTPVGKPPPPRPRRPEVITSSTISRGVILVSALAAPAYPSRAMYSSMLSGLMSPMLRMTRRCCCVKYGISSIFARALPVAGSLYISRSTGFPFWKWLSTSSAMSSATSFW